ncbi:RNA polymerase subunit sigma-24 [Dietzia cinnamea]|nr:RNA polymerase subunit sigma-24 [Dietzia cinnamea]
MDGPDLRALIPQVIGVLVRRGADFAAAEDAVQDALVESLRSWPADPPRDPRAWLIAVAWRRFLDAARSESARRRREDLATAEQAVTSSSSYSPLLPGDRGEAGNPSGQGDRPDRDDTLWLYFLCAHPALPMPSAIALTLRAVGGLTTRQIARAFLVPEATMAQRISRAKRTLAGQRLDRPGDVATVLRVLYLVFNEGYTGEVDPAAEALRLTRQLSAAIDHPEVRGLLALMMLHHARRAARFGGAARGGAGGRGAGAGRGGDDDELIPLAEQDRRLWDADAIAEGTAILQAALARDQLGEYQAQAAIAALHADAPSTAETDWLQIVEWYDELLALRESPVARLGRAVAVGHADGPHAGMAALAEVPETLPRHAAARAYLHEQAGESATAARLYERAAAEATSMAERRYLARKAAQLGGRR